MEVEIKALQISCLEDIYSNDLVLNWNIKDHTFKSDPSSFDLENGIIWFNKTHKA